MEKTTIMTPLVLFFLFLSLTAIPPGAAQDEPEGEDESTDVSAIISKVNENITTGLDLDDIVPSNQRNANPCVTRGCKWPKRGRYVYVPYTISSAYSNRERNIIRAAMYTFHRRTCIRFIQRRWYHWFFWRYRDYIHFFSGSGCYSYIGRQGKRQAISLRRPGCLRLGVVQHEILHALGFNHEQSRSDRDRYVRILWYNIQRGKEHNFRRVLTHNLWTPYDYNSVMHYRKTAFSKNGRPTIIARRYPNRSLGGWSMSNIDFLRVNRLYRC